MGKKHQPSYRIVVIPKDSPVAGEYIDLIGTYNPIKAQVEINKEKALEWLNKGAQPSERIARLLAQAGVEHKSVVVKQYTPKPKEETPAEETAAPVAEEATEESGSETAEETPDSQTEAEVAPEPTEETPAEETATAEVTDTTDSK